MFNTKFQTLILSALFLVLAGCCDHEDEKHVKTSVGQEIAPAAVSATVSREDQELADMEARQAELESNIETPITPVEPTEIIVPTAATISESEAAPSGPEVEQAEVISAEPEVVSTQLESIIPEVAEAVESEVTEAPVESPVVGFDESVSSDPYGDNNVVDPAIYGEAKARMMGAWLGVLNGMVGWMPDPESTSSPGM